MKHCLLNSFTKALAVSLSLAATSSFAGDLEVAFAAGSAWDGKKVPPGQHCDRFDGAGSTPALIISGLPAGTQAVIVEYSDRDSRQMDNGGHGKVGMKVPEGASRVEFPSVPGHTFDLPAPVFMVKAHRNPDWATEGAYMPPCSGGANNTYYLTVIAAKIKNFDKKKFKKLEKKKLVMGNY